MPTGTDHGEAMFAEAGDAATAQTLLTFDDGTLGVVSNTRYNGRGYDCRLELHGSTDSVVAGWDASVPVRNLGPGETFPHGAPHQFFMDRFTRGLPRGTERVPRRRDGAAGFALHTAGGAGSRLDRRGRHPVAAAAPTDQNGRGTIMNRIAGAPISWGVCEVPGWGYQLEPTKVLAEMRELGLAATELGPTGFCPPTPTSWRPPWTSTAWRPWVDSPRCWCTKPATTRCPTSPGCSTPTSRPRPR